MLEHTRRAVLGAVAAVAGPSWASDPGGSTGENAAPAGESDGDRDATEYGARAATHTVGALELFAPGGRSRTTEVEVSSYQESVGLALESDAGRMSVMLLPEDVDATIAELADAKERLHPVEVEEAREWVDEDYRE